MKKSSSFYTPTLFAKLKHAQNAKRRACAVNVEEARYLGRLTAKVGDAPPPSGGRGRPRVGLRTKISDFIARCRSESEKLILLPHDVSVILASWN